MSTLPQAIRSLMAVHALLDQRWSGTIVLGPRTRLAQDPPVIPSNLAIAQDLARRGSDPLAPDPAVSSVALSHMMDDVDVAVAETARAGRPLHRLIEAAVRRATERIAQGYRDRITTGRLGTNAAGYRRRKTTLVAAGLATGAYGVPPPFGVLTGRLVRAIQAVVSRGRRAGAVVRRGY